MSLIYRNARLPAKVHRAGEMSATAAFPFVPFLSWRNTTASSHIDGRQHCALYKHNVTNFACSTQTSNYNETLTNKSRQTVKPLILKEELK